MPVVLLKGLAVFMLLLSLAGCSYAPHRPAVHVSPPASVSIHDVVVKPHRKGLKVMGYVRSRATFIRHKSLAGDVYIYLKLEQRGVLRKTKATKHRQYGQSALWHFDGILDTRFLTQDEIENSLILVSFQSDD